MKNDAWLEFFSDTAARSGFTLTGDQCELFLRYMLELQEWNRTTNITRIVEPRAVAIKHFLDSILITRFIDTAAKHIADVGSGGGFPGIPLAILDPGCRVVLIESVRKKCAFLQHAVRCLRLANAEVCNCRAELYPAPAAFDLAVSRAVASLSEIFRISSRLIRPGGSIACMKGRLPAEEIAALKTGAKGGLSLKTHPYRLPEQGDERSLVIMRPCFT